MVPYPTICPELLIEEAWCRTHPEFLGIILLRSCMPAAFVQMKAWSAPPVTVESPRISPASLMKPGALEVPPRSVPMGCIPVPFQYTTTPLGYFDEVEAPTTVPELLSQTA